MNVTIDFAIDDEARCSLHQKGRLKGKTPGMGCGNRTPYARRHEQPARPTAIGGDRPALIDEQDLQAHRRQELFAAFGPAEPPETPDYFCAGQTRDSDRVAVWVDGEPQPTCCSASVPGGWADVRVDAGFGMEIRRLQGRVEIRKFSW